MKHEDKWFHNLLQKLVDGKLITSLFADEAKREFHKFVSEVCENKALFWNHDVRSFYMVFTWSIWKIASILSPLPMFWKLFWLYFMVRLMFSMDWEASCWNHEQNKFDCPMFHEYHMLLSDYHCHDMPIAKELVQSVRNTSTACKEAQKQKRRIRKESRKRSKAS